MAEPEVLVKVPEVLLDIISDVIKELKTANKEFPLFNSYHEGYAVLKEEVDELWDEIKKKRPIKLCVRSEATQVASMAIKLILSMDNKSLQD